MRFLRGSPFLDFCTSKAGKSFSFRRSRIDRRNRHQEARFQLATKRRTRGRTLRYSKFAILGIRTRSSRSKPVSAASSAAGTRLVELLRDRSG
jgi:hypothetical protein